MGEEDELSSHSYELEYEMLEERGVEEDDVAREEVDVDVENGETEVGAYERADTSHAYLTICDVRTVFMIASLYVV